MSAPPPPEGSCARGSWVWVWVEPTTDANFIGKMAKMVGRRGFFFKGGFVRMGPSLRPFPGWALGRGSCARLSASPWGALNKKPSERGFLVHSLPSFLLLWDGVSQLPTPPRSPCFDPGSFRAPTRPRGSGSWWRRGGRRACWRSWRRKRPRNVCGTPPRPRGGGGGRVMRPGPLLLMGLNG